MEGLEKTRKLFEDLLDESLHDGKVQMKNRRLSHKAVMGAVMIGCYSSEERFQLSHQLLTVRILNRKSVLITASVSISRK